MISHESNHSLYFFSPSSKFAVWHLLTIAHIPGIVRVKCTFNSSFLGGAVRCWYRTPPLPFLSSYFMLHTFLSPTSSWNAAFKSSTKNLVIVVASSFTHWKHWSSDGVKTSYLKSSHAKLFSTEKYLHAERIELKISNYMMISKAVSATLRLTFPRTWTRGQLL